MLPYSIVGSCVLTPGPYAKTEFLRGADTLETLADNNPAFISEVRTAMILIAEMLVDDPAAVRVDAVTQGESTLLRVHVAAKDKGKLIGGGGRTARSLRNLFRAASHKYGHQFSLDIVDQRNV